MVHDPRAEIQSRWRRILNGASELEIPVRLVGGLAFWQRCPESRSGLLQNRSYSDIDIAAHLRDRARLGQFMVRNMNLQPDPQLETIPGARQSAYYLRDGRKVCDVYYDTLVFCRDIEFSSRLEADPETLPLAELLLSKLQIMDAFALKDLNDIQALLFEHDFGQADGEQINIGVVVEACSRDWGLEWCVRHNCERVLYHTQPSGDLSTADSLVIKNRIDMLNQSIRASPKRLIWHLRSWLRECVKPYRLVDSLEVDVRDQVG